MPGPTSASERKSLDAERHLAWVRFAIIAFNIASYYLLLDREGTRGGLALFVSITAGAYAVALVTLRPYERLPALRSAIFTVLADSALIFLWLSATGAAASPYVFLWFISLGAVAFRFGGVATLVATVVYIVLDVGVVLQSPDGRGDTMLLLSRMAYIAFMGAIGAFMADDAASAYAEGSRAMLNLELAKRDARRKKADQERWRALAEASLEGLALHRGGTLLEVNHAMAEILGRDQADLVGTQLLDIVVPASRDQAGRALEGETDEVVEVKIERPDGTTRTLEMKPHDTRREDGALVLAVRDVTELHAGKVMKERAEEQDVRIRRLEAMDRFKTDFINTAAHELNTPLTPLMIQLKVLRRDIDEATSEARGRSVLILERNLQRLSRLVADMMDVARLQSGRLHVAPDLTDVSGLVQAEVEVYGPMADDGDIVVETRIEPDLRAWTDGVRAGQVLSNLLSNAFKFTGRGGKVSVEAKQEDDGVTIRVKDSGVGLTQEQAAQLFEPFVRVHDTHVGGTGLGLYIARSLVEAMGGHITCNSDGPGRGAEFVVWLPATPPKSVTFKQPEEMDST